MFNGANLTINSDMIILFRPMEFSIELHTKQSAAWPIVYIGHRL